MSNSTNVHTAPEDHRIIINIFIGDTLHVIFKNCVWFVQLSICVFIYICFLKLDTNQPAENSPV